MAESAVLIHRSERTLRLILDRPSEGNLLGLEALRELAGALEAAKASDTSILALSANGPDFSLGRDQAETTSVHQRAEALDLALRANAALREFDGVSMAIVRGRAIGFACGLVTLSDLAIASDAAGFAFDEMDHGFVPTIVASYLRDYVPAKQAAALIVTASQISAREGLSIGVVNRVVPDGELDDVAQAVIAKLEERDPLLLRQWKRYWRAVKIIDPARRDVFARQGATQHARESETVQASRDQSINGSP